MLFLKCRQSTSHQKPTLDTPSDTKTTINPVFNKHHPIKTLKKTLQQLNHTTQVLALTLRALNLKYHILMIIKYRG